MSAEGAGCRFGGRGLAALLYTAGPSTVAPEKSSVHHQTKAVRSGPQEGGGPWGS